MNRPHVAAMATGKERISGCRRLRLARVAAWRPPYCSLGPGHLRPRPCRRRAARRGACLRRAAFGRAVGRALRAFCPAAPGRFGRALGLDGPRGRPPASASPPRPFRTSETRRPGRGSLGAAVPAWRRSALPFPLLRRASAGRPALASEPPTAARAAGQTQPTATGRSRRSAAAVQAASMRGEPEAGRSRPGKKRSAPKKAAGRGRRWPLQFYRTCPRTRAAPPAEGGRLNPEPAGEGAAAGHATPGCAGRAAEAGAASEPSKASASGPRREGQTGAKRRPERGRRQSRRRGSRKKSCKMPGR